MFLSDLTLDLDNKDYSIFFPHLDSTLTVLKHYIKVMNWRVYILYPQFHITNTAWYITLIYLWSIQQYTYIHIITKITSMACL